MIIRETELSTTADASPWTPRRSPRRHLAPLIVVSAFASIGPPATAIAATSTVALTLEDAYAQARARSAELITSRERIVQAELQVDRAWALWKPRLNAQLSYRHQEPERDTLTFPLAIVDESPRIRRGQTSIAIDADDTIYFSARATWTVLDGRVVPLVANAEDGVRLEQHRAKADEARLLLGVARAFMGAIAATDAVEVARRAEGRAHARVALAEARSNVGEQAPKILEVERLGVKQAALDVRRADNAALQARLALAFAMGADVIPGALTRPPPPVAPADTADALVAEAQSAREDVRAARVALEVAERGRRDAWWKFAPTLQLFGGFRYDNLALLGDRNDSWSVGATATWLLYDGGLRYADLAEADSKERVARAALEKVELSVSQDVTRARLKLESAAVSVERAETVRALAAARSAVARTQSEAGAARPLDLQEAEDAERDAETAVISATLERDAATLELLQAVGRFAP